MQPQQLVPGLCHPLTAAEALVGMLEMTSYIHNLADFSELWVVARRRRVQSLKIQCWAEVPNAMCPYNMNSPRSPPPLPLS